ncbi:unnamed protein product [Diamesa serratosioi]
MLNLHQGIAKTKPENLSVLLETISQNQIYKNKPAEVLDPVFKSIVSLLNFPHSRQQGLQLFNSFLDQYSVISSTGAEFLWVELLLKISNQKYPAHVLSYTILNKIVKICSENPDLHKTIQTKYLQKIVENITALPGTAIIEPLKCLKICMKLHPGTCGIYKNKIEAYLKQLLDNNDDELIEIVGQCLHLLQQTRGGGTSGGVHKKCWAEYQSQIVGSVQESFDKLMKNVPEIDGALEKSETLKLPNPKLSTEPVEKYTRQVIRFKNLCKILEITLLEPFPTAKTIQVARILGLVEKGLSIDQAALEKKSQTTDNVILGALLPQIQTSCLELLQCLILLTQQNILPHSKVICDIVMRVLKQTSPKDNLKHRTNVTLRSVVYETMILFLNTSSNNAFVKNCSENLLKEIILDTTPRNNAMCLMIPTGKKDSLSRKQLRKVQSEKKVVKAATPENLEYEQELCVVALELLNILWKTNGTLLKPVLCKIVQDKILFVAFSSASRDENQSEDLYTNPRCRIQLMETIYTLMSCSTFNCPPPLSFGLELLKKVKQTDYDYNVRKLCDSLSINVEKLIHNKKEVFYFPTDIKDFRDTIKYNEYTLKKFNEITEWGTESKADDKKDQVIIVDTVMNDKDNVVVMMEELVSPKEAAKAAMEQSIQNESIEITSDTDIDEDEEMEVEETLVKANEIILCEDDDEEGEVVQTIVPPSIVKISADEPAMKKPKMDTKDVIVLDDDDATLLEELYTDLNED